MTDTAPPETLLDDDSRMTKFVHYLATLTHDGGTIEEHRGFWAIVSRPIKPVFTPNVVMTVVGIALWISLGEVLFLFATIAALIGWHRKLQITDAKEKLMIRIDELGAVSTTQL